MPKCVGSGTIRKVLERCKEADDRLDSLPTNDIHPTKISILREGDGVGGARDLCARMLAKFPRSHSFLAPMERCVWSDAPRRGALTSWRVSSS